MASLNIDPVLSRLLLLLLLLILWLLNISTSLAETNRANGAGVALNPIDRCWRRNPRWASNRQQLALCSIGFTGKMKNNIGRGLRRYTVTNPADDPMNPKPGTLRYGVTFLKGKVWIDFQGDMVIKLKSLLYIRSYTTIDGRGAKVEIAHGAGFMLKKASNVIIHGLTFHHCEPHSGGKDIMGPAGKLVRLGKVDGDAIRLVGCSKIWIDHNTFYQSEDGLVDVTLGSTDITISNNWFRNHDKVMLLGHDDGFVLDRKMKVTVAFNRFGPKTNQRMPRVRYGYAHVVNNLYDGWGIYAIGGSMDPSIRSEGNLFVASKTGNKAVTWRGGVGNNGGGTWNWRSIGDKFINGAFFKQTGRGGAAPKYNRDQRFPVGKADQVRAVTTDSGALQCSTRSTC